MTPVQEEDGLISENNSSIFARARWRAAFDKRLDEAWHCDGRAARPLCGMQRDAAQKDRIMNTASVAEVVFENEVCYHIVTVNWRAEQMKRLILPMKAYTLFSEYYGYHFSPINEEQLH